MFLVVVLDSILDLLALGLGLEQLPCSRPWTSSGRREIVALCKRVSLLLFLLLAGSSKQWQQCSCCETLQLVALCMFIQWRSSFSSDGLSIHQRILRRILSALSLRKTWEHPPTFPLFHPVHWSPREAALSADAARPVECIGLPSGGS